MGKSAGVNALAGIGFALMECRARLRLQVEKARRISRYDDGNHKCYQNHLA
jgi:hypothetical protein